MIYKEEVGVISGFQGVFNLTWICLKRKEKGKGIPGRQSNMGNSQEHKAECAWHSQLSAEGGEVREAVSDEEAGKEFGDPV